MEGQGHPKQTEYFADGHTNPQPGLDWDIPSAPGKGEAWQGEQERDGEMDFYCSALKGLEKKNRTSTA